jgi:S1-C subfamily serine protease
VQQSLGSGVIVRADGLIVTNNHVVEGGRISKVALSDKREFKARSCCKPIRAPIWPC